MNHPVEKDSLPASLNAMTLLCAALSTAAAGITGVSYVLPQSPATVVVSAAPSIAQPDLEAQAPLAVPAGPIPAVEDAIKPNPNIKDVLSSVEPPKVNSHDDLAEAFKTGAALEKRQSGGEEKKSKTPSPRQVVRVIAPEHKELPTTQKSSEGGMPMPTPSSKQLAKEENAPKAAKIVPSSAIHSEQPQNFKPLDLAQKAAEQKQPASVQKQPVEQGPSYQGPTIVAVSADRVWVRVGETRTAVLVVGDNLQGIGKVTAIQNGVVKFENGLTKSVGDIIK